MSQCWKFWQWGKAPPAPVIALPVPAMKDPLFRQALDLIAEGRGIEEVFQNLSRGREPLPGQRWREPKQPAA